MFNDVATLNDHDEILQKLLSNDPKLNTKSERSLHENRKWAV